MKILKWIEKNKRIVYLIGILMILVAVYISVSYMEAGVAFSKENILDKMLSNMEIVIGGEVTGIKLLSTGVLVMEVPDKLKEKLKIGDVILEIDGVSIESNKELVERVQITKDKEITFKIDRKGRIEQVKIKPTLSDTGNGIYEVGVWVKDSSAGVGTISFYDKKSGSFAALGHGITETSENIIIPILSGGLVKCDITSIKRGYPKEPGEISGTIYRDIVGQIEKNTSNGIYGKLENIQVPDKKAVTVAHKNGIKEGKAEMYLALDGRNVDKFDIEIKKVLYGSTGNKNMIIEITDKELLEKTGGIVQGMSGSPIMQSGKFVGVVTHVFLNEPREGYAVFAENMIIDMGNMLENIEE